MGTVLLGIVAVAFMFALVIGIHELGHFATAKWSRIRVDEFAIGFGPRVFSRTRGETVYSVRALPLGGFVKMPGMSALEGEDGGPRGFMHARLWKQCIVLVAGVTMNFLLAGLLFGVLKTQGTDTAVFPNLPAAAAGLSSGDEISAAGGMAIDTSNAQSPADVIHAATDSSRGAPVTVTYRTAGGATATAAIRPALAIFDLDDSQPLKTTDGTQVGVVVVTAVDGKPVGTGDPGTLLGGGNPVRVTGYAYGAAPSDANARVDTTLSRVVTGRQALGKVAAGWYLGYAGAQHGEALPAAVFHGFTGLPSEVAHRVKDIYDVIVTPNSGGIKNFQGPVGIAHVTSAAASAGWVPYVEIVALVSLSLGLVNILPIPPFDGGRLVLVLGQAFRRRGSGARLELGLVIAGALAVGTLFVLITINDIKGL